RKATHYVAQQMQTMIIWNRQDGSFHAEPLPFRAQWTPIHAILAEDLDGDGAPEIMMGGNLYAATPQAGRYDAGYGVVLRRDSTGRFVDLSSAESGFRGEGEIRDIERLSSGTKTLIAVSYSGRSLDIFRPSHETQRK
ncbi:MAG: VCBS repeat-containing protein, partial [Bacteroidetes bacterium]|nr:VCBS repeat-containing protein [Bacteroidota bacterium]